MGKRNVGEVVVRDWVPRRRRQVSQARHEIPVVIEFDDIGIGMAGIKEGEGEHVMDHALMI